MPVRLRALPVAFFQDGWTGTTSPGSRTPFPLEEPVGAGSTARAVGTKTGGPGVRVGVGVAVEAPDVGVTLGVGLAVAVPVRVADAVGVRDGVGVIVAVEVCVRDGVGVRVGVGVAVGVCVGVLVGPAATGYEKRSAHAVVMHAVQVAQVPLFPKISIGDPAVFQALTTYWTVVPAVCAGIVAVTTSTVWGVPLERSMKVQPNAAVATCVVPLGMPKEPEGADPSVVK